MTYGRKFTIVVGFLCSIPSAPARAQTADPMAVEVTGGTLTFVVGTNVPAVNVHGKSTALQARVRVRTGPDGPQLEQIDAAVPVGSLRTGMGLRDSHMRKYVFTTGDGQTPDLRFVAAKATCEKVSGNQSTCRLNGDLTIRGTARPFAIDLKVTDDGGAFRASGDSVVKLSAYGIPKPSQLGVSTSDEVKVRLEFAARPAPVATTGVKR